MPRKIKPIPKQPVEISQAQLSTPYLTQGKMTETDGINRAEQLSSKNDNMKDFSIGLEDIDEAVLFYFNNVIKPSVVENGQRVVVPVIYGSPEKWKTVQQDGFFRAGDGKIMVPLIIVKRDRVEKNRDLGNKLDGSKSHLFQVFKTGFNRKNAYDNFNLLNNIIPSDKYQVAVVPDYLNIEYTCVVFTNYVEQNNKLIEAIEFASDSYWGDSKKFKFKTRVDSFSHTHTVEQSSDRAIKTSLTITLNGYIIPDTINKDIAAGSNKFYTKSQIVFNLETVNSSEIFTADTSITPRQKIETYTDSYNVNVIANTSTSGGGTDPIILTYLNTNRTELASSKSATSATFSKGFLSAPSGLPATSLANFMFFLNGQYIEPIYIVDFADNGNGTTTLTLTGMADLESSDDVTGVGKFSS